MRKIGAGLTQWRNNLKWRVALKEDSDDEEAAEEAAGKWKWLFLKSRGKYTRDCPLVQYGLDDLISDTWLTVIEACNDAKYQHSQGTLIGIAKIAW